MNEGQRQRTFSVPPAQAEGQTWRRFGCSALGPRLRGNETERGLLAKRNQPRSRVSPTRVQNTLRYSGEMRNEWEQRSSILRSPPRKAGAQTWRYLSAWPLCPPLPVGTNGEVNLGKTKPNAASGSRQPTFKLNREADSIA